MRPRAEHDTIGRRGTLPLEALMHDECTVQIVRVVPAAHGHHRWLHVLQMRAEASSLPEGVVGAMRHHVVPEWRGALEVEPVRVGERSHREKKSVAVVRAEIEARWMLRRGRWPRSARRDEEVERARE